MDKNTLIGALVAFLLSIVAFFIQEKVKEHSTKKEWNILLSKELEELRHALNVLKNSNTRSFINVPIIDSFLRNSVLQQLFSYSYLAELCNIYCKVNNYNKYIEIDLLNPNTFDDDFFKEKITAILVQCDNAQEIKYEKRKLHN